MKPGSQSCAPELGNHHEELDDPGVGQRIIIADGYGDNLAAFYQSEHMVTVLSVPAPDLEREIRADVVERLAFIRIGELPDVCVVVEPLECGIERIVVGEFVFEKGGVRFDQFGCLVRQICGLNSLLVAIIHLFSA